MSSSRLFLGLIALTGLIVLAGWIVFEPGQAVDAGQSSDVSRRLTSTPLRPSTSASQAASDIASVPIASGLVETPVAFGNRVRPTAVPEVVLQSGSPQDALAMAKELMLCASADENLRSAERFANSSQGAKYKSGAVKNMLESQHAFVRACQRFSGQQFALTLPLLDKALSDSIPEAGSFYLVARWRVDGEKAFESQSRNQQILESLRRDVARGDAISLSALVSFNSRLGGSPLQGLVYSEAELRLGRGQDAKVEMADTLRRFGVSTDVLRSPDTLPDGVSAAEFEGMVQDVLRAFPPNKPPDTRP